MPRFSPDQFNERKENRLAGAYVVRPPNAFRRRSRQLEGPRCENCGLETDYLFDGFGLSGQRPVEGVSMATTKDLNDDLSVGMTEIRKTIEHYGLGDWNEYLVIRKPGKAGSFIILNRESDKSDFADRLRTLHVEHVAREG